MPLKNTTETVKQPKVWVKFTSEGTSALVGNIWPGARRHLDKDIAARFVKNGSAVYTDDDGNEIEGQPEPEEKSGDDGKKDAGSAKDADKGGEEKPLGRMNKAELLAKAAELGIDDVTEDNNKAEIVEKIEAFLAEKAKAE